MDDYLRGFDDYFEVMGFTKEADTAYNYLKRFDPEGAKLYQAYNQIGPQRTPQPKPQPKGILGRMFSRKKQTPEDLQRLRNTEERQRLLTELQQRPSYEQFSKLKGMRKKTKKQVQKGKFVPGQGVRGVTGGPGTPQEWAADMQRSPEGKARLKHLREATRLQGVDPEEMQQAEYARQNPEEWKYQQQQLQQAKRKRRAAQSRQQRRKGGKPEPLPQEPVISTKAPTPKARMPHPVGKAPAPKVAPVSPGTNPAIRQPVSRRGPAPTTRSKGILGGFKGFKGLKGIGRKAGMIGGGLLAAGAIANSLGAFNKKQPQQPQQNYDPYGQGYGQVYGGYGY